MLRSLGMATFAIGLVTLLSDRANAQAPIYDPAVMPADPRFASPDQRFVAPAGTYAPLNDIPPDAAPNSYIEPVNHSTDCNFDPYAHYNEAKYRHARPHLSKKYFDRYGHDGGSCGAGACADGAPCGGGACDASCGSCRSGKGGLFGDHSQCASGYCDAFPYANAHRWLDFEKRFFLSYSRAGHANSHAQAVYGDSHNGQAGVEMVPFILTDGSAYFSRWGGTVMFNYAGYDGNPNTTLQSQQTGNILAVDAAEAWSLYLGPTYRIDFEIFGLRFSPNVSAGVTFDWTTVETTAPVNLLPRPVNRFKRSGFDAGAYIRFMLDWAITDNIHLGFGGDYRHVPTDVMLDNDPREHIGAVFCISHNF